MRQRIIELLKQQGQTPVINAIAKSREDLKRAGYDRTEIKDTIKEWIYGLDGKVDTYINNNF